MRTKLLGALMVFGIITGTAHASSKLEITDPRAAKIEDIVELPIKGFEPSKVMGRSCSSLKTDDLLFQDKSTTCGARSPQHDVPNEGCSGAYPLQEHGHGCGHAEHCVDGAW